MPPRVRFSDAGGPEPGPSRPSLPGQGGLPGRLSGPARLLGGRGTGGESSGNGQQQGARGACGEGAGKRLSWLGDDGLTDGQHGSIFDIRGRHREEPEAQAQMGGVPAAQPSVFASPWVAAQWRWVGRHGAADTGKGQVRARGAGAGAWVGLGGRGVLCTRSSLAPP